MYSTVMYAVLFIRDSATNVKYQTSLAVDHPLLLFNVIFVSNPSQEIYNFCKMSRNKLTNKYLLYTINFWCISLWVIQSPNTIEKITESSPVIREFLQITIT